MCVCVFVGEIASTQITNQANRYDLKFYSSYFYYSVNGWKLLNEMDLQKKPKQ